jgi:hypothetical protein
MTSLTKSKTLFGFTSPRTIEKIIPELKVLIESFNNQKWSGKQGVQEKFFQVLFDSQYYEGEKFPTDPSLAARDRITRAPKAFGFINLTPFISLTSAGKQLLTGKRLDELFTRQLLKFQLPSPYHTQSKKITFGVKPYLELLRLIRDLGSLSKTEIALFFLQLTHYSKYDQIVRKIISFRKDVKVYNGSRKIFVANSFKKEISEVFCEEINNKILKTRESEDVSLDKFIKTKTSNMKDYADAFIRYIRSTELITFEKRTFRLIISPQKVDEVDFILETVSREPLEFSNEAKFREYLYEPRTIKLLSDDKNLLVEKINNLGVTIVDDTFEIEYLKDLLDSQQESLKLKNIDEKRRELKGFAKVDDIIEVFDKIKSKNVPDAPLFLEWNVWRSFVMLNYARRIDGNFVMDIDGMPLNTAPGKKPDLEIEFDDFGIIGEVTLSSGQTQFKMEGDSVPRHYGEFKKVLKKDTYCIFIAPKISEGTAAHFFNLNKSNTVYYGGKTKIIPLSLDNFIDFINVAVKYKFSAPTKLKDWLEEQWKINQSIEDEVIWCKEIEKNIKNWAA